jgi:HAD superfamily hydrolase (TIGR01509 family)
MRRAFIFDVDGTLVDTTELHVKSWIRAFKESGFEVRAEDVRAQIGRRALEIAGTLVPDLSKDELIRIVDAKWRIFKEYFDKIRVFPKTRELFLLLDKKGIKTALATSTIRRDANFYVELLGLKDLVRAIVTAEDITRSKPDPEIFLKAATLLGVKPGEAVAVGDSPHDMKAATSAGMLSIGVLTGGYTRDVLLAAGADKIYLDIADIYENLDEIL